MKKKIVDLQKKNGELHSQLFEEQKESSKLREENKILRKQHDEMTSFAKHTGDENDEVWSERVTSISIIVFALWFLGQENGRVGR